MLCTSIPDHLILSASAMEPIITRLPVLRSAISRSHDTDICEAGSLQKVEWSVETVGVSEDRIAPGRRPVQKR